METGEPMEKKRIEGRRGGQAGTTQQNPLVQAAEVNAFPQGGMPGSIVFLPGEVLPPSRGQEVSPAGRMGVNLRNLGVIR